MSARQISDGVHNSVVIGEEYIAGHASKSDWASMVKDAYDTMLAFIDFAVSAGVKSNKVRSLFLEQFPEPEKLTDVNGLDRLHL